jgi:hypothetical protein
MEDVKKFSNELYYNENPAPQYQSPYLDENGVNAEVCKALNQTQRT